MGEVVDRSPQSWGVRGAGVNDYRGFVTKNGYTENNRFAGLLSMIYGADSAWVV